MTQSRKAFPFSEVEGKSGNDATEEKIQKTK